MALTLYHFTCAHRAPLIQRSGELRPSPHPLLGASLVWLTDVAESDRWALGLTSSWITCDRTAVRVCVPPPARIVLWRVWALKRRVPLALLDTLHDDGARPEHWWVSDQPVRISGMTVTATATSHAGRET